MTVGYDTTYRLSWEATAAWKPIPSCEHKPRAGAKFCAECGVAARGGGLDAAVAKAIKANTDASYALNPDGTPRNAITWYGRDTDLRAISFAVPGVLFHLEGEGGEPGDLWDLFALDGRTQTHKAKIIRVEAPDPAAWDPPLDALTGAKP